MEETGETANMALLDGDEIVYVAQVPSKHSMRMFTEVGRRVLPHSTGVGKALLAHTSPEEVRALLARTGMPAATEKTITTPDGFLAALEQVRTTGYAVDDNEQEIGGPLPRRVGPRLPHPGGDLHLPDPRGRVTEAATDRIVPILQEVAQDLSQAPHEHGGSAALNPAALHAATPESGRPGRGSPEAGSASTPVTVPAGVRPGLPERYGRARLRPPACQAPPAPASLGPATLRPCCARPAAPPAGVSRELGARSRESGAPERLAAPMARRAGSAVRRQAGQEPGRSAALAAGPTRAGFRAVPKRMSRSWAR